VSSPPPSPEDGNRSSFRNVVLFGIQDDGKVQKNSVNPVHLHFVMNWWMVTHFSTNSGHILQVRGRMFNISRWGVHCSDISHCFLHSANNGHKMQRNEDAVSFLQRETNWHSGSGNVALLSHTPTCLLQYWEAKHVGNTCCSEHTVSMSRILHNSCIQWILHQSLRLCFNPEAPHSIRKSEKGVIFVRIFHF
jgi:hypothetical protein